MLYGQREHYDAVLVLAAEDTIWSGFSGIVLGVLIIIALIAAIRYYRRG